MSCEGVLIRATLILTHPIEQEVQLLILGLLRRVFFRFPRASPTVSDARLDPRVQKTHLGGVRQHLLQEVAIAAFDDPLWILFDEVVDCPCTLRRWFANRHKIFPRARFVLESGQPRFRWSVPG